MIDTPGPMPTPTAEEPELFPGGVDAIEDQRHGAVPEPPVSVDMPPDKNPATDSAPDEVTDPDDKQQEPDTVSGDAEGAAEPPA